MLSFPILLGVNVFFFFLYISTPSAYPNPLPKAEENELIELSFAGDHNARNKLIEHNMRLVAHIVKKYYNSAEHDDLLSIGTIGLIKGIDSFNPSKGIRLATYVARCIENVMCSQRL